jgi:Protein of unknown function (DUF3102)
MSVSNVPTLTRSTRLSRKVRDAEEWAGLICAAWQKSTAAIVETGGLLIEAKADLAHGEWRPMVEGRLPFGKSTTAALMQIAQHPILANVQHVGHLPPSWGTLAKLAALPEPKLRAAIASGAVNPKTQRKDVAALLGTAPPRSRAEASVGGGGSRYSRAAEREARAGR